MTRGGVGDDAPTERPTSHRVATRLKRIVDTTTTANGRGVARRVGAAPRGRRAALEPMRTSLSLSLCLSVDGGCARGSRRVTAFLLTALLHSSLFPASSRHRSDFVFGCQDVTKDAKCHPTASVIRVLDIVIPAIPYPMAVQSAPVITIIQQ